jgi:[acyl-carrier-protein] S-malonyltransferase
LTELISHGPELQLAKTEYTQPAIVLASLCQWEFIKENNIVPKETELIMAGNSIGEYSALAAAGWMSFDLAVELAVPPDSNRIMLGTKRKNIGRMRGRNNDSGKF